MLIVGDLSGIQDYLFDVAHEGGGQARRLRARSFFIQLLAECIALRIRRAAGWEPNCFVFCGAGKFLLEGPALSEPQRKSVQDEQVSIAGWLLREVGARLRFALAFEEEGTPLRESYERVMQNLQREKLRTWLPTATQSGCWQSSSLVLEPLDTPCALCHRRKAECVETDAETNQTRKVCRRCFQDRETGKKLPQARWLVLRETPQANSSDVVGLAVSMEDKLLPKSNETYLYIGDPPMPSVANIASGALIERRLARHIPVGSTGELIDFTEMAAQAKGDHLLGVLKADADSLGVAVSTVLNTATDFSPLRRFSQELDDFFARQLDGELRQSKWEMIYTVFAGGDDLLLVGPWNVMVEFAGHVQALFKAQFGKRGLTISAALTFVKPKRPIKFAAEQAEDLLEMAKTQLAPGADTPKDQLAAFGQIWKWKHHQDIVKAAKNLTDWVDTGVAERGWVHTLLRLALQRQNGDLLSPARLVYHVARNYPEIHSRHPQESAFRSWANRLIAGFDQPDSLTNLDTRYLPAIARYALAATRKAEEED